MSLSPKSVLDVVFMIIKQSGNGFLSLEKLFVQVKKGEAISDYVTDGLCDFRHTI